ncbi:LysE family translocator [Microbacterium trichothecenolyticum]|nr:LysE family translocator [Microbacterium trichothecenolyticum]
MPGADTILVLRTSLRFGARKAIVTAAGVVCGPVIWGALAGLGMALVISRLPIIYSAVALAGALYLVYLGIGSVRAARTLWRRRSESAETAPAVVSPPHSAFLTGLMTNLLNPKIGVFYLAVMPGLFAPGDVTIWLGALLGAIHGAIGLIFLTAVAIFAAYVRRFLTRPTVSAAVELACGLCLFAFALFVIMETVAAMLA